MASDTTYTCDRCGKSPLAGGNHHEVSFYGLSSIDNRRDIFGDSEPDLDLCDDCYQPFHRGLKAWLRGATIIVNREEADRG